MELRIVSLNVWDGGRLMPQVVDFLKQYDSDIVALQEVYDGKSASLADCFRTMQILRENLNYTYDSFAQAYLDDRIEGKIPYGNGLLSKFPIAESARVFLTTNPQESYVHKRENFPLFPSIMQLATIETEIGRVYVGNIHGVWDLDGDNPSPARQQMVDEILKHTLDLEHVVLLGDTNARPTNPAMRRLEETFVKVFNPDLPSTFNMKRKDDPGYATSSVDLMYVSQDWQIASAECPAVDISDHLPLVVRVIPT